MPEPASLRPAVFLDRDGTISEEVGYLNHLSRFRMFEFAGEAIRRLNAAGWPVFVVTNQSGVARGLFPESLIGEVHEEMNRQLAAAGARLDGIYYCPHHPEDGCECRKPKPGLLERAAREQHLDLRRSVVVGDRYLDVDLARRAGARSVLVKTGYGRGELEEDSAKWPAQPDYVAEDLAQAVDWILRHSE
jgi:D-glycero-D-manno-heptose 1,7-bisphosphate phosphatase